MRSRSACEGDKLLLRFEMPGRRTKKSERGNTNLCSVRRAQLHEVLFLFVQRETTLGKCLHECVTCVMMIQADRTENPKFNVLLSIGNKLSECVKAALV